MQDALSRHIELYIGSQIEYERIALQQIIDTLNANDLGSVLIANVNLRSRQIDLIVATENLVLASKTRHPC